MNDTSIPDALKAVLMEWHEFKLPVHARRDLPDDALEHPITAIIGPRRAGKTWICYQLMESAMRGGLRREEIVYCNFEDERLHPLTGRELSGLLDAHASLFGTAVRPRYCFLDEIQNAPNWSKWVRRVSEQRTDMRIVLTGSSSRLLSSELATELRGRSRDIVVMPFSFREYAAAEGVVSPSATRLPYSETRHDLRRLFDRYLRHGGFPGIRGLADPRETLQQYYRAMFMRDMIERFSIGNVKLFEDFLKILISRFSALWSVSGLAKELEELGHGLSKNTLMEYGRYAREVFFLFEVHRLDPKIRNQLRYPRKIYAVDTGLLNAVRFSMTEDRGRLLENAVFLELRRRFRAIHYYANGECDFLVGSEEGKPSLAIQSCWSLGSSSKTRQREVEGLRGAAEAYNLRNAVIVTADEHDEIETGKLRIRVLPFWMWALETAETPG